MGFYYPRNGVSGRKVKDLFKKLHYPHPDSVGAPGEAFTRNLSFRNINLSKTEQEIDNLIVSLTLIPIRSFGWAFCEVLANVTKNYVTCSISRTCFFMKYFMQKPLIYLCFRFLHSIRFTHSSRN